MDQRMERIVLLESLSRDELLKICEAHPQLCIVCAATTEGDDNYCEWCYDRLRK